LILAAAGDHRVLPVGAAGPGGNPMCRFSGHLVEACSFKSEWEDIDQDANVCPGDRWGQRRWRWFMRY
jgi:hypothetical protein